MENAADIRNAYEYLTGLRTSPSTNDLLTAARNSRILNRNFSRSTKTAIKCSKLIRALILENGVRKYETLSSGPVMPSGSLVESLTWCLQLAEVGRTIISKFIQARKEFGKFLLHGDYESARQALETIRLQSGHSLYYIEKRLLLETSQHGSHAARAWLDDLTTTYQDPGICVLTHVYQIRAATLFNRWSFDAHLENIFNIRESDLVPLTRNEFHFLIDGAAIYFSRTDLESIACRITRFGFIDAYLMTLKLCRLAIFSNNLSENDKIELSRHIRNLIPIIKDEHLDTLGNEIIRNLNESKLTKNEEAFLDLQGKYFSGAFQDAVESGQKLLARDPLNAYIYDLLAKSIVHRGVSDTTWKPQSPSLAYRIVASLSTLYSEESSSTLAIADLESIAIALGDNHISYFIRSICQKYQGLTFADDFLRYGFLNHRSRSNTVVFESSDIRLRAFNREQDNLNPWQKLAIDFTDAIFRSDVASLNALRLQIHPMIFAVSAARLYTSIGDWDNVLKVTNIISKQSLPPNDLRWFRQLAVFRLRALLLKKQFAQAKELFSYCYCRLNNFIGSVDLNELCHMLETASEKNEFDIELLALNAHRAEDLHDRALKLRELISINDVKSKMPSDLIIAKMWESSELAALVFTRLFTAEVLKFARLPRNSGTNRYEDALNEYLNICGQFLHVEEPVAKRDICLAMIAAYVEKRERRLWEAVEGPRIIVRIEKFRTDLQPVFESQFNGYNQYSSSAKLDVIERCLDVARSEFLYNKRFGLTSSLGTKIRHGFFYNAFFDALEGSGLAGRKRIDGIDNWAPPDLGELGVFSSDPGVIHLLKKGLGELSSQFVGRVKRFRDSTIALISADTLREGHEGGRDGSEFNFDSFEIEVRNAIETMDFNGSKFFDWSAEQLLGRLKANLKVIRNRICGELCDDLNSILEQFINNVNDLKLANHHKQGLAARATNLQAELRLVCARVSQWFEIVQEVSLDCATIGDVFRVISKDAAVSNRCVPVINLEEDLLGTWSEVDIWYHVFSILFENARLASRKDGMQYKVELFSTLTNSGCVVLGCRNQLSCEEDATKACARIDDVVFAARQSETYGTKESGIARAIDLLEELPRLNENLIWKPINNEVVVQFTMKKV